MAFVARFQVGWGDLDANNHLKNTAYLDYAANTRLLYLASAGFSPAGFREAGIGPAVLRDEVTYKRELLLLERFDVDLRLAAMSEDGARYVFCDAFVRDDGTPCAEVRTTACWFDLQRRKVTAPPPALLAAMEAIERTADFRRL